MNYEIFLRIICILRKKSTPNDWPSGNEFWRCAWLRGFGRGQDPCLFSEYDRLERQKVEQVQWGIPSLCHLPGIWKEKRAVQTRHRWQSRREHHHNVGDHGILDCNADNWWPGTNHPLIRSWPWDIDTPSPGEIIEKPILVTVMIKMKVFVDHILWHHQLWTWSAFHLVVKSPRLGASHWGNRLDGYESFERQNHPNDSSPSPQMNTKRILNLVDRDNWDRWLLMVQRCHPRLDRCP